MKLELEHLAPYLPYGLKLFYTHTKKIGQISNIYTIGEGYDNDDIKISVDCTDGEHIWMYKPILRPLKEMYQVEEIMDEFSEYHLELFETSFFILGIGCTNRFSHLNVDQYNMILKNHFDIFGLIEQGLAIDINTL
jgi:hypothetical protein|tara:strand:+ start:2313 stop:2720 length:408 start_codon:yes stop_codon:yes gene_type:complete